MVEYQKLNETQEMLHFITDWEGYLPYVSHKKIQLSTDYLNL